MYSSSASRPGSSRPPARGVLAQAALAVVTLVVRGILSVVAFGLLDGMFDTLITSSLVLIGINVLPIHPLDGKTAWRLFGDGPK